MIVVTFNRYLAPDGSAFYFDGNVNDPDNGWRRWVSLDKLTRTHEYDEYGARRGARLWFTESTRRAFGARNRHLVCGAVIETRMKAPDDMRYGVTWFGQDGEPITTASFPTLARARGAARRVYRDGFALAGE